MDGSLVMSSAVVLVSAAAADGDAAWIANLRRGLACATDLHEVVVELLPGKERTLAEASNGHRRRITSRRRLAASIATAVEESNAGTVIFAGEDVREVASCPEFAGARLIAAPPRITARARRALVALAPALDAIWVGSGDEAASVRGAFGAGHEHPPIRAIRGAVAASLGAPPSVPKGPGEPGLVALLSSEEAVATCFEYLAAAAERLAREGPRTVFVAPRALALRIAASVPLSAVVPAADALAALARAPRCVVATNDPRSAELRSLARLYGRPISLVTVGGVLGADDNAEDDPECAAAGFDPGAVTRDVAETLGLPALALTDMSGARLARNLDLRVEIERARFNPWTRLLRIELGVRGAIAPADLAGSFEAAGTTDLVNAWVAHSDPRPGFAAGLRATAVVPAEGSPRDLFVLVEVWGRTVARVPVPDPLEEETSGLIALTPTAPDEFRVEYWGEVGDTRLQVGTRILDPEPSAAPPGRPAAFAAAAPWPKDRETVTTLGDRSEGQRFTALTRVTGPRRPSSARLAAMRDTCADRTAWLIGNGPSVRTEDLDRIAHSGHLAFGFNRFHLAHDRTCLRPHFTVTGDRQMIEDFGDEIVGRSGGIVFVAHERPPGLAGEYCWVRQIGAFPSLFSRDASRHVTPGGSSLYVALQIGHFLGIRRWFLYGADFAFRFDRNSTAADGWRSATGDGNHFIPGYRGGRPWCPPSIENILPSFLAARQLMESEGGFIRNATWGGALEVFERISFDDAVATP